MIEAGEIRKSRQGREVLRGVDLCIGEGEIFCIVGPNGAGKTTLLRLLDLLERPDSGWIRIMGEDVTHSREARFRMRRRMSMLFQRPVVFNTSVFRNVALGLEYRGMAGEEIRRRVQEALRKVSLEGYEDRAAVGLSGGEMQRLSLARAIVTEPEVLFLDEPTANLDPRNAEAIEGAISRLSRERNTTIVLCTHDLHQGQRLADRIGVMIEGRLQQVGSSLEVLEEPATAEIARFVGVENVLPARVLAWAEGEATVEAGGHALQAYAPRPVSGEVCVSFRAEDVIVGLGDAPHSSARNRLQGRITRRTAFGPFVYLAIDCGFELVALVTKRSADELGLSPGREVIAFFKAASTRVHVPATRAGEKEIDPGGRE